MNITSHGGHISAIIIGAFQAVAPELVASGFFKIVSPPYYKISSLKDDSVVTYVKGINDIASWYARVLYYPGLEVAIGAGVVEPVVLDQEEFVSFAEKVTEIGETLDNLEKDLAIPQFLIEAMMRCTFYLSPLTMNVDVIGEECGADRVNYDVINNALVITIGIDDYMIPLHRVVDRLYETLLPLLQRIKWKSWVAYVTTKRTELYRQQPMSLYQIYSLFKMMDKLVRVEVLKGIGSMSAEDAAMVLMNVRNRRLYHVTSPGDVATIFNLLGDNSEPKKQLLAEPVYASSLAR